MSRRLLKSALGVATLAILTVAVPGAQTKIVPPKNSYSLAQDVELGREAAGEARKELPLMSDDAITSYVEDLGQRLVGAIPAELRHSEFHYTFETVNVRDINAFALPGGPMFVHRGMVEAAATEGEVAGVMAHEISHVVLRHGTAQASKAGKYQAGQVAGAILGAIIGGNVGSVISQGTQFGLGAAFLRYGREYEKQADIQGAQIMARAGYDARDMANMFKTIEKTSGGSGPEWLSDHPNPGNRSEYITQEAQALRVTNPITDTTKFERVKAHLKTLPKAPTSEEVARAKAKGGTAGGGGGTTRRPTGNVPRPSSQYRTYTAGNVFKVTVPSNWKQMPSSQRVMYAPDGAFGTNDGQTVFTHGIEFGVMRNEGHDLQTSTEELVDGLSRGNPQMRSNAEYRRATIGGQAGLTLRLSNVSEVTKDDETVQLLTTQLSDGSLFYAIAVAPEPQFGDYQSTFQRVVDSVQFMR